VFSVYNPNSTAFDVASFNIIKFYPIAFILTEMPSFHNLPNLDDFHNISYKEERELSFNLKPNLPEDWPENYNDGFKVFGASKFSSRNAIPWKK
jgi:hypothetical protein